MAGEKAIAINRAWERWPNIDTETVAEVVAAGFDAGRASRDAEVAKLTKQRNEWASRMMEFASAEARAEAAEAVIADLAEPGDPEARMNAYYYGFDRTGVGVIDDVLAAVVLAGKAFHNTDQWCEPAYGGDSPEQRIQQAANRGAERIRAALALAVSHPEPTEETNRG